METETHSGHCRVAPARRFLAFSLAFIFLPLGGCSALLPRNTATDLPKSIGEDEASYSYIPLDPLPVLFNRASKCSILDALPDEAVRIAVGTYDATGSLSYGPGKVGLENHTYQVVLDYIDVDEATLTVEVTRTKIPPAPQFRCPCLTRAFRRRTRATKSHPALLSLTRIISTQKAKHQMAPRQIKTQKWEARNRERRSLVCLFILVSGCA